MGIVGDDKQLFPLKQRGKAPAALLRGHALPGKLLVGDAGETRDKGRHLLPWGQADQVVHLSCAVELTILAFQPQSCQLQDMVLAKGEACGLCIQNHHRIKPMAKTRGKRKGLFHVLPPSTNLPN